MKEDVIDGLKVISIVMQAQKLYSCNKCTATKKLVIDRERSKNVGWPPSFPLELPCGWRGCDGTQTPSEESNR